MVDEILSRLLPAELKRILAEIDELESQKEKAVADQEWDQAMVLRDQQRLLKDRLPQVGQNVIDVQPDDVLPAIYSLRYDQPIHYCDPQSPLRRISQEGTLDGPFRIGAFAG